MNCILSLSGGMDSGTLLRRCQLEYGSVLAVGFTYGSKHNQWEQICARRLCEHYDVEFIQIDITSIGQHLQSNLLKSGGDIPEGHYEEESMKQTVVPGRNTIFMAILMGIAESRGAKHIAVGIHSGDHAIYPDCRPGFYKAFNAVCHHATEGAVEVVAPFLHMDKTSILEWGFRHEFPYNLTRTCYKDQRDPCGKCGACQERLEAFSNIRRKDPVRYEGENSRVQN